MPDWRSDISGPGSRAMTDQEITDVVAWLAAQRHAYPGSLCSMNCEAELFMNPSATKNRGALSFQVVRAPEWRGGSGVGGADSRLYSGRRLKKGSSYNSWVALGAVNEFPEGETRLVDYRNPVTTPWDGQTGNVACWVRRISGEQFQVFAINCAHLGCPVRWFAQSKLFLCPCHGGAYYADGSRASGPPPRGLFEYKHKISGRPIDDQRG